jgi:hypothetical protein
MKIRFQTHAHIQEKGPLHGQLEEPADNNAYSQGKTFI